MPCPLLKPAKNKIGIVSKVELEKINRAIISETKCNQWHNTQAVIDLFKPIPKRKAQFIKIDIVEFYPSITEKLLDNAVSYAQTLTIILNDIIQLIKQTRKSLLFTKGNIWMKKRENSLFDVTMGSHDVRRSVSLLGFTYLEKYPTSYTRKKLGSCRDDGGVCY